MERPDETDQTLETKGDSDPDDDDIEMDELLCIATIWDFAGEYFDNSSPLAPKTISKFPSQDHRQHSKFKSFPLQSQSRLTANKMTAVWGGGEYYIANSPQTFNFFLLYCFISGKIQVARNEQYLVGGKEFLNESRSLMGTLAKQNDVSCFKPRRNASHPWCRSATNISSCSGPSLGGMNSFLAARVKTEWPT